MANKHRRVKRAVRNAVKKLKRGELPLPPPARKASLGEEAKAIQQVKERAKTVRAELARLETDSTGAGHRRRIRLNAELDRLQDVKGDN